MGNQKIKLSEEQLRELVKNTIMESIQDGTLDEGRLGNFFSSLGQGIKGTVRGGLDQGRQMYNQNMFHLLLYLIVMNLVHMKQYLAMFSIHY